jgi:hypothetical protein
LIQSKPITNLRICPTAACGGGNNEKLTLQDFSKVSIFDFFNNIGNKADRAAVNRVNLVNLSF